MFLECAHWVWSVRYNGFHDQLVLACSSDSRVVLLNVQSLSSERRTTAPTAGGGDAGTGTTATADPADDAAPAYVAGRGAQRIR